jgi:3-hydroxyisobutyrate dehydrogenase
MAQAAGAELPVVEMLLKDYAQLVDEGHGDEDISSVFRLTERLFPQAR